MKKVVKRSTAKKPVNKAPRLAAISEDKKWQAEDDLRTLQRAQEIQKSRSRLSAAKRIAKEQVDALKKVAG